MGPFALSFLSIQNFSIIFEYKISYNRLFVYSMCVCSHHLSSVYAKQCELSCDWRSTPVDRVDKSGHTLGRHLTAAELEADGADTHSHSPLVHSQTQT